MWRPGRVFPLHNLQKYNFITPGKQLIVLEKMMRNFRMLSIRRSTWLAHSCSTERALSSAMRLALPTTATCPHRLLNGDRMDNIQPSRVLHESASTQPEPSSEKETGRKPADLDRAYEVLRTTLPKLFVEPLDYSIYSPGLVFKTTSLASTP